MDAEGTQATRGDGPPEQGIDSLTAEEFLRLDTIAMALNAGIVIISLLIALVIARRNAQQPLMTMECPSRDR